MATATKPRNRLSSNGDLNGDRPVKGTKGKSPPETVPLRPIDIRTFDLPIRGVTSLIVRKLSTKTGQQIQDKQQQKAKGGKEKRDPHAEFIEAIYTMPGSPAPLTKGCRYGIPAAGLKKAAVKACRYVDGINMTFATGAFHVLDDDGGLIQLKTDHPTMRTDPVRVGKTHGGKGILSFAYRPEFKEWSCIVRIRYNASCVSAEQIVNLFHHAGFHIGIHELRPESGFSNGTFEVVTK